MTGGSRIQASDTFTINIIDIDKYTIDTKNDKIYTKDINSKGGFRVNEVCETRSGSVSGGIAGNACTASKSGEGGFTSSHFC